MTAPRAPRARRPGSPRTATTMAAAAVAAGVLLLAGCAAPSDAFDQEASAALHARVVAVAERSSATDYAGAIAELDRLEQSLDASVADGDVPADRETEIREAISLVRADLDALLAAATTPEPAPEPTPAPTDDKGGKDKDDKKNENGNSGNGNSGNGNGNSGSGNDDD
ncbi:hypothetical protein ACGGZK_05085 [Agromyces sp. MMS24-K17]|uniref:hypothetical protein n=1 Tax=Agromyces sp. MMS24-K17 TaxID=3372850 RepID=UPI0037540314